MFSYDLRHEPYKASLMVSHRNDHIPSLIACFPPSSLFSDFIQSNVSKLRFYYGTTDAWVPLSYYHEMKDVFPEGDVHLCEEGYEHAFVIKNSEEMGLVVWGWILEVFERRGKTLSRVEKTIDC